jgi:hypothetical protein
LLLINIINILINLIVGVVMFGDQVVRGKLQLAANR